MPPHGGGKSDWTGMQAVDACAKEGAWLRPVARGDLGASATISKVANSRELIVGRRYVFIRRRLWRIHEYT